MRKTDRTTFLALSAVYLAFGGSAPAISCESSKEPDPVESQQNRRTAVKFVRLTGGAHNAERLVAALRTGMPVTLTSSGPGMVRATTFPLPTQPMTDAEVVAALFLAQSHLAMHGISDPSPLQLRAALIGGTIRADTGPAGDVTLPGVLWLRARGMTWDETAHGVAAGAERRGNGLG